MTEVTEATVVGMPGYPLGACAQSSGEAVRSPVHTVGPPVAPVPMATQLLDVQESPVTDCMPEGNVEPLSQVSGPLFATEAERMVGSVALVESPVAMARHSVLVGQVIVPTDVRAGGGLSRLKVGVQLGLLASADGSPSSLRTPASEAPPLTDKESPTMQVVVVGMHSTDDREVKVDDGGAMATQVSCEGEV